MTTCSAIQNDRRKIFWVTQPDACGSVEACRRECGKPGLSFIRSGTAITISTENYIRGLALNILLTNGRKQDSICGTRPGTRGGHWSDSFRTDGQTAGSRIRFVAPSGRINDDLLMLRAQANADLAKLVTIGVASAVDVTISYKGGGVAELTAIITGQNGETFSVGVTGSRLANAWVWKTA